MDRAEALGLITDELIKNAAAYNDAVTENEKVLRSMREEIAQNLLPVMQKWVESLTGWVREKQSLASQRLLQSSRATAAL